MFGVKIRTLYKVVSLGGAVIAFSSCVDKPTYPSEPVIAYEDFIRYGNPSSPDSVEAVFSFTDNEGDIGMRQEDVNGVFSGTDSLKFGNFYMIYFYWDTTGSDHWSPYDLDLSTPDIDTLKVYYRVPLVLPDGDPDEPVKGLLYVKQSLFINPYPKIMYKAYMYDMARHKSNVVDTPELNF